MFFLPLTSTRKIFIWGTLYYHFKKFTSSEQQTKEVGLMRMPTINVISWKGKGESALKTSDCSINILLCDGD
jgi:hypothetical protein